MDWGSLFWDKPHVPTSPSYSEIWFDGCTQERNQHDLGRRLFAGVISLYFPGLFWVDLLLGFAETEWWKLLLHSFVTCPLSIYIFFQSGYALFHCLYFIFDAKKWNYLMRFYVIEYLRIRMIFGFLAMKHAFVEGSPPLKTTLVRVSIPGVSQSNGIYTFW